MFLFLSIGVWIFYHTRKDDDMEVTDMKETDVGEEAPAKEEAPAAEEVIDWQARCLAAENALADSLAFATLETGVEIKESPIYTRYLDLCAKGLSRNEAFAAAGWERKKTASCEVSAPSKAHLVSGAPASVASSGRMSSEDMMLARDLLGEGYSAEEIEKLWRRVAKG